jgi:alcohol dehydrogenase
LVAKELEVVGSHGMAAADYPAMLEMVADGRLDIAGLLGRVVELDQAPAELAAMDTMVAPTAGVVVAKIERQTR